MRQAPQTDNSGGLLSLHDQPPNRVDQSEVNPPTLVASLFAARVVLVSWPSLLRDPPLPVYNGQFVAPAWGRR